MKKSHKFFSVLCLFALLTLTVVTPVLAFEGREGDIVVIEADEVIEDDLYVGAGEFTLEGTIKGDLFVVGNVIIINGTVEGDLFAGANSVIINGTVMDDVRIGGAALKLGDEASIGGDLLAGGASLEAESGSAVGGNLLFGGGQILFAGNVADDVMIGTGAANLKGEFGGDVLVEIGQMDENAPSPSMYIRNTEIAIPSVKPGLMVDEDAKIEGNLTYTLNQDADVPSGTVIGKVTRNEPVMDANYARPEPTASERAVSWTLDLLRSIITLILFGLLLGWLAPVFMKTLTNKLQSQPAASLGWGVVAYVAFFFAIFLLVTVMIIGAVIFGLITLGGISGTIVWVGILVLFAAIIGFVLVTAFLTKIVVAWLGGKWILGRFNPSLAEHKVWPLVLGVVILALLVELPMVGRLIGLIVMFLGLGTLWLWGRDRWQMRKAVTVSA